jgi:hypothetical protein
MSDDEHREAQMGALSTVAKKEKSVKGDNPMD